MHDGPVLARGRGNILSDPSPKSSIVAKLVVKEKFGLGALKA
jgi:hypothetical protein